MAEGSTSSAAWLLLTVRGVDGALTSRAETGDALASAAILESELARVVLLDSMIWEAVMALDCVMVA